MPKDSRRRSITKTITWRITASLDTFLLSFLITGSFEIALAIGATEVLTKLLLYYFHERIWNTVNWGRTEGTPTSVRSLSKTISWRITGTIDTTIIAFFYSGNIEKAAAIGIAEVFTKIFLYYLHERIWSRIKWGRQDNPEVYGVPESN